MSMALTNTEKTEIQISAVLDAYAYLDQQEDNYSNRTLSEIMGMISKDTFEENPYYQAIQAAIKSNPKIGEYRLISQSFVDGKYNNQDITKELLIAVAFQAPDNDDGTKGEIYVAYRGTGDGKWIDNGVGMYQTSEMQYYAAGYFDYIVESQGLTEEDRIIVTGHSKGGNSAQYATIGSENARLVDACYSFDGQGFSDLALKNFKDTLGSNFAQYIPKH